MTAAVISTAHHTRMISDRGPEGAAAMTEFSNSQFFANGQVFLNDVGLGAQRLMLSVYVDYGHISIRITPAEAQVLAGMLQDAAMAAGVEPVS